MTIEKISVQVRQLIRENEQRNAAELLTQALQSKNQSLFNIALVQQANIKKLADQSAAGILATDDINREQAKINAALLHLSDEYARLYEAEATTAVKKGLPRWVIPAITGLAAVLLIIWLLNRTETAQDGTFNLEVYLLESSGEEKTIRDGQINLRLGETLLQSKLPLDTDGRATFKALSTKFRGDSVHLLYFPPGNRRFKISSQSASTITGEDQTIRFALEPFPDTTLFALTLRDKKGRAITEADITLDGNLHTRSDANGYFQIAIPKAIGATALLVITQKGKRIFEQEITIASSHTTLPIE